MNLGKSNLSGSAAIQRDFPSLVGSEMKHPCPTRLNTIILAVPTFSAEVARLSVCPHYGERDKTIKLSRILKEWNMPTV